MDVQYIILYTYKLPMIKAGRKVREKSKYLRISNCMIYNVCVCLISNGSTGKTPGVGGVPHGSQAHRRGGLRGSNEPPWDVKHDKKSDLM